MFKRMVVTIVLSVSISAWAEETETDDANIDTYRETQIKRWDVTGIVTPKSVTEEAEKLFSLPLQDQSVDDLQQLAKKANAAANYVGLILDEYRAYYRENYRYEFIQRAVAPHHDSYVKISNKMKDFRNQAYFNLGKKHVNEGELLAALFYFRDAYRLSNFDDDRKRQGMRYKAEQEMKKLLGIEGDASSFVHWQ